MGRIADSKKYDKTFEMLWEDKPPEDRLEWLVSEGFTQGIEYSEKHWLELKRAMRQRWRSLHNEYVRNIQQHKGRWTSMSTYNKGYYVVGGAKMGVYQRKRNMSRFGGSKFAL